MLCFLPALFRLVIQLEISPNFSPAYFTRRSLKYYLVQIILLSLPSLSSRRETRPHRGHSIHTLDNTAVVKTPEGGTNTSYGIKPYDFARPNASGESDLGPTKSNCLSNWVRSLRGVKTGALAEVSQEPEARCLPRAELAYEDWVAQMTLKLKPPRRARVPHSWRRLHRRYEWAIDAKASIRSYPPLHAPRPEALPANHSSWHFVHLQLPYSRRIT